MDTPTSMELDEKIASRTGYDGNNLIFVIGCPRSGTTWLQRLLSMHPSAHTGQESHIFNQYIGPQLQRWRKQNIPQIRRGVGLPCYLTEDQFISLLKSYMNALLRPTLELLKAGELFIEKTPQHALFIPEIAWLLPKSRFIHIIRDGRDVAASLLAASRSWAPGWAPRRPHQAARTWIRYVTAARDAGSKLPLWQYLEVRYEDLHKDPQRELANCFGFLNLKYSDEIVLKAIEENDLSVAKINGGGSKIPLRGEMAQHTGKFANEPEGFIRSAKVGSWKSDLSLVEKLLVWKEARRTMMALGYDGRCFSCSDNL